MATPRAQFGLLEILGVFVVLGSLALVIWLLFGTY
jgi:hypothetical protein